MHMLRLARPVIYPLALLVGSLFVVAAALAHPDLTGDGAAQLSVIARSEAWRAIHWAFLFGFTLALTGLVGVMGMHVGTPGEAAARAGVLVAIFAYGAWAVLVAFMVGPGWTLARSYVAAEPGLTATHAVFLYDMLHPFALAAQRTAGVALGISTCLFGWAVVNGKVLPRWLGAGAGAARGVARLQPLVGRALGCDFRDHRPAVRLLDDGPHPRIAGVFRGERLHRDAQHFLLRGGVAFWFDAARRRDFSVALARSSRQPHGERLL